MSLPTSRFPEPSAPPRALLLEGVHQCAADLLRGAGWSVETETSALDETELIERLDGVRLLGIRSSTHVTAAVLDGAPDLEAVGAFCIGTNQLDLPAAAERGVAVFNAPFSSTRSVVELALAEIIALERRLPTGNANLHEGRWRKNGRDTHEVRGRCLGIVGYGNIGSQLSVLAESLGMQVVFYDIEDKLAHGNARRAASLDELLETVDTVTVHVDGRPENAGLFGDAEFSRMRPGALFLNLARGPVVDQDALRGHLASGHLGGAAVDVFPDEPRERQAEFTTPLQGVSNVIITPHIAGSTDEAQEHIGSFVAGKLLDFVRDGVTSLSANLPTLSVESAAEDLPRVGHLHRNAPGVLATINKVFADTGVNVERQALSTEGDLGYVVTDVDRLPAATWAALAALPETVALRALSQDPQAETTETTAPALAS